MFQRFEVEFHDGGPLADWGDAGELWCCPDFDWAGMRWRMSLPVGGGPAVFLARSAGLAFLFAEDYEAEGLYSAHLSWADGRALAGALRNGGACLVVGLLAEVSRRIRASTGSFRGVYFGSPVGPCRGFPRRVGRLLCILATMPSLWGFGPVVHGRRLSVDSEEWSCLAFFADFESAREFAGRILLGEVAEWEAS